MSSERAMLPALAFVALAACGSSGAASDGGTGRGPEPELKAELIEVWDSGPLISDLATQQSASLHDVAYDGDDFVVSVATSLTSFVENPSSDSFQGGSVGFGGLGLVRSRDRGVSWTEAPAAAITLQWQDQRGFGVPVGYHLASGNLHAVMSGTRAGASAGTGSGIPLEYFWYALFSFERSTDAADRFEWNPADIFIQGSMAPVPLLLSGTQLTYFDIDLDPRAAPVAGSRVGTFRFARHTIGGGAPTGESEQILYPFCVPANPLRANARGIWEQVAHCPAGVARTGPSVCRVEMDPARSVVPEVLCVPEAMYPPADREGHMFMTDLGAVEVLDSDTDRSLAVRITSEGGLQTFDLGPGQSDGSATSGSPRIHDPWAGLIPLTVMEPSEHRRFVRLGEDGTVEEIPLVVSPCADASGCPRAELEWITPLGGDDYMTFFEVERRRADDIHTHVTIFALPQSAPAVEVEQSDAGPVSPVAACPTAIPASPLVEACIRFDACFYASATNMLSACIEHWTRATDGDLLQAFIDTPDGCDGFEQTFPLGVQGIDCMSGCVGDVLLTCPSPRPNHPANVLIDGKMLANGCDGGVPIDRTLGTCDGEGNLTYGALTIDCARIGATCVLASSGEAMCLPLLCQENANFLGCDGDGLVLCAGEYGRVTDCTLLGLKCVDEDAPPRCAAPGETCPLENQCVGDLLIIKAGTQYGVQYADCRALGFSGCMLKAQHDPGCVP